MLIFFAFDNDDMESSKRRVAFLSLIFLLTHVEIDRYQKYILQGCGNAKAAIEVKCDPTFLSFFFSQIYQDIEGAH